MCVLYIENIALTPEHIGKKVTYLDKFDANKSESGVISSYNDTFVFVKYKSNTCATKMVDLYWHDREIEFRESQTIINGLCFEEFIDIDDIISYKLLAYNNSFDKMNINIKGVEFTVRVSFIGLNNNYRFKLHKLDIHIVKKAKRELLIDTLIK